MAYDREEPLGARRDDLRWASLMTLLVNLVQAFIPAKHRKPAHFEDWLPKYWQNEPEPEPEHKTPSKMLAIVEMWNAALGGKDLRQQHDDPGNAASQTDG
jgi:hypothetical protein